MAAANPVILSSSPPSGIHDGRPPPKACATMLSSPGLPSPSRFFARRTSQSDGHNRRSPLAKDSVAGFTSASTTIRQSLSNNITKPTAPSKENIPLSKSLEIEASSKPVRKKPRAKAAKETGAETPKQLRAPAKKPLAKKKPLADIVSAAILVGSSPDVVIKKKSSTKTKEPAQTKIKKGKVTKAASSSNRTRDDQKSDGTKTGDSIVTQKGSVPSLGSTEGRKGEEEVEWPNMQEGEDALTKDKHPTLGLEKATKRRVEWTPSKDTSEGFVARSSEETTSTAVQATPARKLFSNNFGSLLGDYGFAQPTNQATSRPEISRSSSGEALTKRCKLEVSAMRSLREE